MERVSLSGKRHYKIDGFHYPSVTTVLGETSDKTFLDSWREKVGEEEANRVSRIACSRGTSLHSMIEEYFLNKRKVSKDYPVYTISAFYQIEKHLKLIKPFKLEDFLYSHKLKLAGASDCIGIYDGIASIIDFKTSKWEKEKESIEDYFLQCTAYALMAEEKYSIRIPQIVIIMASDSLIYGKVYLERTDNFKDKFLKRLEDYYEKNSNLYQ